MESMNSWPLTYLKRLYLTTPGSIHLNQHLFKKKHYCVGTIPYLRKSGMLPIVILTSRVILSLIIINERLTSVAERFMLEEEKTL